MAKKPKRKTRKKTAGVRSTNLTPRAALFVLEYLKDLNATKAAIRAGFSENGAKQAGSRLLTNVDVQAAVAKAMEDRAKAVQTDAEWLLKRLREEADADIGEVFNPDGTIKPLHEWPAVWRKGLMMQMEVRTIFGENDKPIGSIAKIKPSDRHRKLMAIGQHTNIGAFLKGLPPKPTEDATQAFLEEVYGNSIRPGGSAGKVH